jgi:hypothetical protein
MHVSNRADRARLAYEAFFGHSKDWDDIMPMIRRNWQAVADALDRANEDTARQSAEAAIEYLSGKRFQGEPILHAIICCDHVSRQRMITAVAKAIDEARKGK